MTERIAKEFSCRYCGKTLKTQHGLNTHERSCASNPINIKDDSQDIEPRPRPRQADRTKRVPLGVPTQKMTADHLIPEGKVGRWINDKGGRIQRANNGGYEFVQDPNAITGEGHETTNTDLGSYVSQVVGTKENGDSMRSYLMVIDKDLYEEDQEAKQKKLDEKDEMIRRGRNENTLNDKGYIPKGGISYETGG